MASQIRFKVACPSCEAAVPIRDLGLVGRKVECPKCKYRFVVEEPEGAESAKPAKGQAAKKSGGKSNKSLMIGAGVGGVAVVILAVVGFLMWGGDGKPKPSPNVATGGPTTPSVPRAPDAPVAPAVDAKTDVAKAEDSKPLNPPAASAAVATVPVPKADSSGEISNFLPNESQSITELNMDELRHSTLGQQLFESQVGFKIGMFKQKIGIDVKDMQRLVRGENVEHKWTFNVLRLKVPVKIDDLKVVLKLEPGPKGAIKGRAYWKIGPNELIDHLTDGLKSELEVREDRAKLLRMKDDGAAVMGLFQLDETTLVFANIEQIEQFLRVDCKPRMISKPAKPLEDGSGGNDRSNAPQPGQRPGGRPMVERMSMMTTMQDPGANATLTDNATFLTVEQPLKSMYDRLRSDPKSKPIFTMCSLLQSDQRLVARIRKITGFNFKSDGMRTLGVLLDQYNLEKFYATVGVEFFNENNVKAIEDVLKKQFAQIGRFISAYLGGIKVEVEGGDAGGGGGSAGNSPGGRPGGGGGRGSSGAGEGGNNNPGGASLPGVTTLEEGPASKVKLSRKARYLFIEFELNTIQRAHDRINQLTLNIVSKMRGFVDMASTAPHWTTLSDAAIRKSKDGDAIPRGAYPLAEGKGGRMARNWEPWKRVSWMAGLLPYLGQEDLYRSVEKDKPWREERNLKAGSILIPAFLDPRTPDKYWYANIDSLGVTQAVTHFVGVAGVGAEAGDYNPSRESDPKKREEMMKKMGAFNFERPTSLDEVKKGDGLANTIYIMQVPPTHQRPWIAGGGATVVGVPEKHSVRDFVATYPGSKRGTYVIMMDGSVRFIADTISDEAFKALCTIRGGEKVDDLDKVAPKVNTKSPVLKTDDDKKDEDKDK